MRTIEDSSGKLRGPQGEAAQTYRITIGPFTEALATTIAERLEAAFAERDYAVGWRKAVGDEAGAAGAGEAWVIEIYAPRRPDLGAVQACLDEALPADVPVPAIRMTPLPDEDWVARSQAGLAPVRAGPFLIHGSHDRAAARASALAIEIDAGQAFGTAHHGTTSGCLQALGALARRYRPRTVLDLGTGSGVLAIAAARLLGRALGAKIIASDCDPIAIAVARENCRRNGVAGHVVCVTADGLDHPLIRNSAPYDLIVANILAEPLRGLAAPIARALAPGGHLILSGLLVEQAARLRACYHAHGLCFERDWRIDGWATLLLRYCPVKRQPPSKRNCE